jgi:hypothetical protein
MSVGFKWAWPFKLKMKKMKTYEKRKLVNR